MQGLDDLSAFADRCADALDRSGANISHSEHARHGGLQRSDRPARDDETGLVDLDAAALQRQQVQPKREA